MTRLPLAAAHQRAHTYCTYCPKLCRFACPVSTAQASETTTPWGKMAALHHVAGGSLPLEPSLAKSWWACTGCLRCRSHCDHGNEVAAALHAGRAEALRGGVAPPTAEAIRDAHETREARAVQRAGALFGADAKRAREGVAVVAGCTAVMLTPEAAQAGLRAVEKLSQSDATPVLDGCCGMPLLDAGDLDGFKTKVATFIASLAPFDDVVFQDPGCLYAVLVEAPRHGVEIDSLGQRAQHLSQLAAAKLSQLRRLTRPLPRYHDPCRLGRGLGIYDEPRQVLESMLGRPPAAFAHERDDAECCGAGGQLPRTDPATAGAIAHTRLAEHDELGAGDIVTSCPASLQAFRRNGASAVSLAELIDEATR